MPFSYRISEEEGVAYVTASGSVDVRSSVETMGELSRDPIFDPDFKVVVDLREMQYRPSLGELRQSGSRCFRKCASPTCEGLQQVRPHGGIRARAFPRYG